MAKRKGDPVHGWLVLDKPIGLTSTKALAIVRRLLNASKAGHAGTLDPLASGVLPLAFGEATKTVPYLVDARKAYRFTVKWGAETSTDDSEGPVTRESSSRPTSEQIVRALPAFVGQIMQVPPAFSAIKVDGERAYDLARDGEVVELAPRLTHIHRLELVEAQADAAVFEMTCGKGTYVRAFARDLGRALRCLGHVIALTRLSVGPFDLKAAISLESLEKSGTDPSAKRLLMPLATALDDIPGLAVTDQEASSLRLGQAILARGRVSLRAEAVVDGDAPGIPVYCRSRSGDPVAIAMFERGELRPTRVFNFSH
ncbi:MAG: tRNA pseudouridine(55) synthase TruB [Alphaproteobacteria bacterium]|nr:tRNA pseudouridine(55) synthase TruB [Alphaproteobacteria bacterium]